MIDLKRYHRLHPAGLCWVEQFAAQFVAKFKRFDNETGKELEPEPNYFTLEELEKERQELKDKLEAADSILSDII